MLVDGGMVARRGRRQKDDYLLSWVILISIVLYGIYVFSHHDLLTMALYTPIGLAIPSWFLGMQIPNRCGVATVKDGHPCRLRSYGVIFGCWQYHFTTKARARMGKRRQVWEQPPASGRGRKRGDVGLGTPAATSGEPVQVKIVEDMKSRITFCFMVLTTLCTLMTTGLSLL